MSLRARLTGRNAVFLLVAGNTIASITVLAVILAYTGSITSDAESVGSASTRTADLLRIHEQVDHIKLFVTLEDLRAVTQSGRPIPGDSLEAVNDAVSDMEATTGLVDFGSLDGGLETLRAMDEVRRLFIAYVNEQSPQARAALGAVASTADERLQALDPLAVEQNDARLNALVAALQRLRWSSAMLAGAVFVAMQIATWKVGHRLARTVTSLNRHTSDLASAHRNAERRNAQFRGLYFIVSEVMETLSIKYVVQTTVREARKLVEAEVVILRVLEDGRLRTRGVEAAEGIDVSDLADDLGLGEGLAGRAAKRGRTVQLELPAAECEYSDGRNDVTRTGVIVPLIVGARVVGTISCWAPASGEFDADDVQVLEMMASQVASAIAAAELHEESEREAHHDPPTALPNRRQLSMDVRYELDAAARRGRAMSIAMLDIDHFKRFNDTHGHQGGDAALQRVAGVLLEHVRKNDQVYRYGGEEFLVVFDSLSLNDARDACGRLLRAVEGTAIPGIPGARLTISAGVVATTGPGAGFDALLRAADEALYAAKDSGRNCVVALGERAGAIHATAA